MGFKLFDFAEVRLSKVYLKSLPKRHLNFIVSASLAGNDISVLSKILIGYRNIDSDGRQLAEIRAVNHWTVRRILAAKVFEFTKLFERYGKALRRSKLAEDISYADEIYTFVDKWKSAKEFEFVKKIRDSATNHYFVDECEEGLARYKDATRFGLLLHNQSGNSYYPIGEEIAHLSFFDTDPNKGMNLIEIEEWFQHTASELIRLQHKTFNRIFEKYPIEGARKITIQVDDADVTKIGDRMPILYFDAKRSRF